MIRTGIDDTQGMATGSKIEVNRLDDRILLVKEIDGHQIAHGGSHLVHQTAGLAEEHILRVLADHGDFGLRYLAIEEQTVDDGADQHLIGSGRRQTAAGQNGGLAVSVEAFHLAAQLRKAGGHTADQRGCGVDLLRNGSQIFQIHNAHGITLGLNADGLGSIDTDCCHRIQIHGAGQNTAPLMIGMVAADFGTAGSGKITLRRAAKGRGKTGIQCVLGSSIQNKCRCGHNGFPHS